MVCPGSGGGDCFPGGSALPVAPFQAIQIARRYRRVHQYHHWLTSTTGLVVGEYVTLSAGFPTTGPYQVIEITSTTAIKVNANSNAVSSNITVSTPDPVFKAMAAIAP